MWTLALIPLVLAAAAPVAPTPTPRPTVAPTATPTPSGPSETARREYCSLLARCGLPTAEDLCTDALRSGVPEVTYDDARCQHARTLASRGLSSRDPDAFAVYRFLGKRFRVTYVVDGELPMSPARLAFLLDDLPLAAKLLSRLGRHAYTAEYIDDTRRRFRGSKEGTLTGEAAIVAGRAADGWIAYFGRGRSKVGFWRLGGLSFAEFRFEPAAAGATGLRYSLQIVVTPDNAVVNRIMTLGLFRGLVNGQIRQVVDDIDRASRRLAERGASALNGEWTPEERARVDAFLHLP
jgi:hypothetical protein